MSGSVASQLVLLSHLDGVVSGTKVRFLGWYVGTFEEHVTGRLIRIVCCSIDEYLVKTATLRLKHEYTPFNAHKFANVDIQHVLESVKRIDVDVGTWLNVIGYVEAREEEGIFVQAVVVWNAGNVDLEAYENSLLRRKAAG
jgi:hypothetical protein